jgi:ferritin-like metal-binding protein YciE
MRTLIALFGARYPQGEQVARLEQVFASIDAKPVGKKCAAIEGILDEGKEK